MTNYNLQEFKGWLEKRPEKKAGLDWSQFLSYDFISLIGWAKDNKNNTLNTFQRQYQVLWNWKEEVDNQQNKNENKIEEQREEFELFDLLFPNQPHDFNKLKQEIAKLRNKNLAPQVRKERAELEQLIITAKNKAGNNFASIIDLLLQVHKGEDNEFTKGQSTAYKNILQGHLSNEEIQTLLSKQKEVFKLENQLNKLQTQDLAEKGQFQVDFNEWLREVFSAFFPNKIYNFVNLKEEIKRLKLDDLSPEVKIEKEILERLITDNKSKVASHSEKVFEFLLQTQRQAVEQKEENDPFVQGQLTAFSSLLQEELTSQELQRLLDKQRLVIQLEQQLVDLQIQEGQHQTKAQKSQSQQQKQEQTARVIETSKKSSFFGKFKKN